MKRKILVLFLVFGLAVAPGTSAAAPDPRFETYVPEPTLTPGQQTTLSVQVVNDAKEVYQRTDTARDVRATLESGQTDIEIKSGTKLVGNMPDGATKTLDFRISVPANISSGTYTLPLKVRYDFEANERNTKTLSVKVTIEDRPRFTILGTESDVNLGDKGDVQLRVKNVGSATAYDSVATFSSQSPSVTFGESSSSSRYVGAWETGEVRTLTYEARAASGAERQSYTLKLNVSYEDDGGTPGASRSLTTSLVPGPEQEFSFENVESTLRVGEEGAVRGTVVNEGPEDAREAVLKLTSQSQNVHPKETAYSLGTLSANESAEFDFTIEISEDGEPKPRQLSYVVEYRNQDGETRTSETLNARVQVAQERDQFVVESADASVAAGSSGTVNLSVTNNGEKPLRNVNAKLFVDDPLSAGTDEAFVSELAPGESATLTFDMSAAGTALTRSYPVSIDFQYDTESGESKLSKTYQVPVDVSQPEQSGSSPLVLGGGIAFLVIVLGGGWFWWNR